MQLAHASEEDIIATKFEACRTYVPKGVTTLEIKSGYGLDLATELKILRVAKQIGEVLPLMFI